MLDLNSLDFGKGNGLVTVIVQDADTGVLLMVAHADREAVEKTIATSQMHYRSRSRGPWHKGATSGNVQHVVSLAADCDGDAILARVRPAGPACHAGTVSCFGDAGLGASALQELAMTIAARSSVASPTSYTARLLADRNLRLKKLGEETAELVTACADGDAERAREEAADLFYHALVALQAVGVSLDDVQRTLSNRRSAR